MRMHLLGGAAVALCLLSWPIAARAQTTDCNALPNPVFGIGGSAHKPLVAKIAGALAAQPTPISVIYQAPGACVGVLAVFNKTKLTGTASYWDATGKEQTCTISTPVEPTYSTSGNSSLLCSGKPPLPEGVGDFVGPVSSVNLFVPSGSSQQSISAEAIYFVYGFGPTGQVSPWTEEHGIIRRDESSFVQLYIGKAAGIPGNKFFGDDAKSNSGSISLVTGYANPEAAIGFASSDVTDANRDKIHILAYQHTGQSCGYWPDSSRDAFDKLGVRTGLYYLWSAVHVYATTKAGGEPIDDNTATVVGLLTGKIADPKGIDYLTLQIKSGGIPLCAMQVNRDGDLGPLYSYQPDEPCGCFFEKVATGATTCTACTDNAGCGGDRPVCRHGYCEVK